MKIWMSQDLNANRTSDTCLTSASWKKRKNGKTNQKKKKKIRLEQRRLGKLCSQGLVLARPCRQKKITTHKSYEFSAAAWVCHTRHAFPLSLSLWRLQQLRGKKKEPPQWVCPSFEKENTLNGLAAIYCSLYCILQPKAVFTARAAGKLIKSRIRYRMAWML